MDLNAVDLALGLVALTGVTLAGLLRSSRRFARRNLFFRFAPNEPLDVVLSVSKREEEQTPVPYTRDLTSVSHLQSAAKFSQAVGGIKRRDQVQLHASRDVTTMLANDLVVIGGPAKNGIAELFVSSLRNAYPALQLEFRKDPKVGAMISIDGEDHRFTEEKVFDDQQRLLGDYGLIVAWVNPFAVRRRRAFLCAGVTSYGTAAATSYFLDVFMHDRYRRLLRSRARWPRPIRAQFRLLRWPCFVLLVRVTIGGGQFYALEECRFVPLTPPRRSELPLLSPDGPPEDIPYAPASAPAARRG